MPREPLPPEPGDDTLDRLLAMSSEPPQLEPDARDRLLARLQASRSAELNPAAPRGAKAPMNASTATPPPPAPPSRLRLPAYALAVAASGLLVWGATRFGLPEGTGPEAPVPQASLEELKNDAARPRLVTLADGTTLLLRQGAALRQDGPRALTLLQGEALIEVAPDPAGKTPFTIASAAGQVTVLGTKFLLREAAGELMAGVLRGELKLVGGGGEATLQAGEAANMAPGAAPIKRTAERLSHEVAWARDGLQDASENLKAVRRGNLVARNPTWPGEWPLPLRVMDVDVYVEDGVARTTIDQTFFNHTDYQLEGVYSFPLPTDAAIARLAMYVDGKLMEAGITERQEGREIYESIVYRRRDPALLEWMQGNEFRMRVFPLPARTEKRILLSYTQPLAGLYGDYSVRVPIPELDLPVGTVRYRVHVKDKTLSVDSCCVDFTVNDRGDERIAEATLTNATIGEDLALTLYPTQKPPAVTTAAMADPGGDYFMVRARPELPGVSQHTARRWVVLHDTSASRSPTELAAQTRFLRHLLRELDEADRLTLLAFDSTVRPLPGGFSRVDALDLGTVDNFLAREGRDHVGASDLGAALDQALALLDTDAGPEAPHILYLGDGLLSAPGDAPRKALRDRLIGGGGGNGSPRATFVAAALGDENDLPLLDELATATGGLRVQLTAGADLRWQALDLAAALNTARVHELRAKLLGAGDQPLTGEPMLSANSAADGEAVVILSRGTGASEQVPKAMLLEGKLAGAPWSQRVELPPAKANAGYLPRLWARARVAADIASGAEANKKEITELGLEHFLVTPFTSLLVLENEAMYKQFKVRRPDADGWAHYAAPADIKVVHEPRGAATATTGQIVLRQPIDLIGLPPQYGDEFSERNDLGIGGLGLWGTGRGGGGSGEGTIGLGLTGLIGKGGGGTGSGYGRGAGAGFGGRGTRVPTVRMGGISFGPTVPDTSTSLGASLDARFVTGRELAKKQSWSRDDNDLAGAAQPAVSPAPTTAATRASHFMPEFAGGEMRRRSANLINQRAQAQALTYIGDPRLGDLGEHVPALFEDGFDRQRERLLAATAAVAEGEISPEARELLTRARASLTPTLYAVDGGTLGVEKDGRFTRSRRIGGYLDEVVRYDGDTLVATYPELGLAVQRRVGLAEPALLSQWVPWLLPSPDSLARWYVVTLIGDHTLRLQQRGSEQSLDLDLDAQLRVVSIRQHEGDKLLGQTRFEYDSKGLTIVTDDDRTRIDVATTATNTATPGELTTLTVPLRSETDIASELATLKPEDPRWRTLQRERVASLAALGQSGQIAPIVHEMRAQAPLTRGELVLAGAGIVIDPDKKLEAELAKSSDPVAAYLVALRRARKSNQTGPIEQVAKASSGTLVGLLASHARLLLDAPKGINPQSLARLQEFITRYHHADLSYVATQTLAGNYYWRSPGAPAPAWEAVAAAFPEHRPAALHAAGTAYQYTGNWSLAGERFEQGLAAAVDLGQIPIIDWSVRSAIDRAGGQAGWRLQWSRWREAVQKSGDPQLLSAFLAAAQMLGDNAEIHRVIANANLEHMNPDDGSRLALALVRAGLPADAQIVLRPLLAANPEHAGLLALAAILAEHTGDLRGAADLGERALASESELPLARLRAAYRSLFDLRARVATTHDMSQKPGDRDPLDMALDVAARWRAEDPDNAEIDERCATLLFSVGQPAEAMRHLESIVERHPAEGQAHARVARMLEREGRFEEADQQWQQATAVEPTDPTALLGRAHNRLATGDATTARTLVEQVVAGKWQDRFWQATQEAKSMQTQLAPKTP